MTSVGWCILGAGALVSYGLYQLALAITLMADSVAGIERQMQPRMPLQATLYAIAKAIYVLEPGSTPETKAARESDLFRDALKNENGLR